MRLLNFTPLPLLITHTLDTLTVTSIDIIDTCLHGAFRRMAIAHQGFTAAPQMQSTVFCKQHSELCLCCLSRQADVAVKPSADQWISSSCEKPFAATSVLWWPVLFDHHSLLAFLGNQKG